METRTSGAEGGPGKPTSRKAGRAPRSDPYTKLRGPGRGVWFQLYLVLDIVSRYVLAWTVQTREDSEIAKTMLEEAMGVHGIPEAIHADRGTSMTSKPVAQQARLRRALEADQRHDEVYVAWQCAPQLRSVYHQHNPAEGRRIATKIIASFPTCPILEIARLGRTLRQWRQAFLAYFDTGGASNGGTEAPTAASNSTAASHEASETATTTDYACS